MRHSGLRGRVRANPGTSGSAAGSAPAWARMRFSSGAPEGGVGRDAAAARRRDPLDGLQAALSQRHHQVQHVAFLTVHALAEFGDLLVLAAQADFLADGLAQFSSTVCRRAVTVLVICSSTRRARVSANSLWIVVICARSARMSASMLWRCAATASRDFAAQAVDPGFDAVGQGVVLRVQLVEFRLDLDFEFGQAPVDLAADFGEPSVDGRQHGVGRLWLSGGPAAGAVLRGSTRRCSISLVQPLTERSSGVADLVAARRAALRVRVTPTPNASPSPKATARVRQTDESRLLCI